MDDEAMAALMSVMETLWRMARERPDKPCTLARLSKQAALPMSALRRQLTALVDAGWVVVQPDEGAVTGAVALTSSGTALCGALFSADFQ
ncbi:MAG: ArsR family transcriptional regulator [Duganella sp.]